VTAGLADARNTATVVFQKWLPEMKYALLLFEKGLQRVKGHWNQ